MRGTTVDAEPMRQESASQADLPGALYAAQNGDERGFGVLYRDLQPRLVRYATVLVGRDDADHVTVRNRALDFLRVPYHGNPRP